MTPPSANAGLLTPVPESVDQDAPTVMAPSLRLALILAAVAVIVSGFFPQILAFFGDATRELAAGF